MQKEKKKKTMSSEDPEKTSTDSIFGGGQRQHKPTMLSSLNLSSRTRPSGKRASSSSRPKTTYQLAHPPMHQRLKRLRIRPRVFLQLQQTSHTPRPIPMLDVVPWYSFWSTIGHYGKLPPSMVRAKYGRDLVVVRSELFEKTVSGILDSSWDYSEDAEDGDAREVVATLSQQNGRGGGAAGGDSSGKAEIRLVHGPAWEASVLENGIYEFTARTPSGVQIARWVPRAAKKNRASGAASTLMHGAQGGGKRFTFSVIDPTTRRHPVIASMTRNCIKVFDTYSQPAGSRDVFVPARRSSLSGESDQVDDDVPVDRPSVVETDDDLRTLIVVTGILVAFREGWSPIFSYDDDTGVARSSSASFSHGNTTTSDDHERHREEPLSSPTGGGEEADNNDRKKRELSLSKKLPRRSHSTASALTADHRRATAPAAAEGAGTRPRRYSTALLLSSALSGQRNADSGAGSGDGGGSSSPDINPRPRLSKVDLKSTTRRLERGLSTRSMPDSSRDGMPNSSTKGRRRHRLSSLLDLFTRRRPQH